MEEIILNIIMHSGKARSHSMDAIAVAKTGDFNEARELIEVHEKIDSTN